MNMVQFTFHKNIYTRIIAQMYYTQMWENINNNNINKYIF